MCTTATAVPAKRAGELRGSAVTARGEHGPLALLPLGGREQFRSKLPEGKKKKPNQTKPTNPTLNDLSLKVKLQKYNEELKGEAQTRAAVHEQPSRRCCCLSRGAVPPAELALPHISNVHQAAVTSACGSQLSFLPFLESFWLNSSIFPRIARKPLQAWCSHDAETQGCFQEQPQVLKPHQNLTKTGHIWFKMSPPRGAAGEGELGVPWTTQPTPGSPCASALHKRCLGMWSTPR